MKSNQPRQNARAETAASNAFLAHCWLARLRSSARRRTSTPASHPELGEELQTPSHQAGGFQPHQDGCGDNHAAFARGLGLVFQRLLGALRRLPALHRTRLLPRVPIAKPLTALGLTILLFGCDNSARAPISPSTPTPTPNPAPTPPPPMANNVLSGVVFEVTSSGRSALGGVTIDLLTCGAVNCPGALTAAYEVKTGEDGSYRISGVYNGDLNYLWVLNAAYELVDPMAPGTCPDRCDRVVAVNGDTRLDIDLVRR